MKSFDARHMPRPIGQVQPSPRLPLGEIMPLENRLAAEARRKRSQRVRTVLIGTAAFLGLIEAQSCSSEQAQQLPPTTYVAPETSLLPGQQLMPIPDLLGDSLKLTGVATLSDSNTFVSVRCYGETIVDEIDSGGSPNSLAQAALRDSVVFVRRTEQNDADGINQGVYEPADLDQDTIDRLASGLQAQVLSLNRQDYPQAAQAYKTFGHCLVEFSAAPYGD